MLLWQFLVTCNIIVKAFSIAIKQQIPMPAPQFQHQPDSFMFVSLRNNSVLHCSLTLQKRVAWKISSPKKICVEFSFRNSENVNVGLVLFCTRVGEISTRGDEM
jgi:hypothetical protein